MASVTSSQNTLTSPARKVAKRTATADAASASVAPAAVAPVAPVAAVAAVASAPKAVSRRSSPAASTTPAVAAPVVVAPATITPAVDAAPAASETTTLADEVATLQTQLTTIRDAASASLAALKRVTKRAAQEVKDARKNRRRQRSEPADGEPRKPSNFEIPVPISDELSTFLGRGKNSSVSRAFVNKSLNEYIKSHSLNQGQNINPDAPLRKLLSVPETESLTIFNLQKYLRRHFLKPAVKTVAPAAKA
jgi:hypothetical protein